MSLLPRRSRSSTLGDGSDSTIVSPSETSDHGSASHIGRRSENQDRAAARADWVAVSDGIGGHKGGALAAELTIQAVAEVLDSPQSFAASAADRVREAFRTANVAVRQRRESTAEVADMGATLTLAIRTATDAHGSDWLVAGIGDSPAWVVSTGHTRQVTADDNLAAELARTGAISAAEAASHPGRHLLLRAVGLEPELTVHPAAVRLGVGDALVVASDGLSAVLGPEEIGDLVRSAPSMTDAARVLVDRAVALGTTDNVTVAAVRQAAAGLNAGDHLAGGRG